MPTSNYSITNINESLKHMFQLLGNFVTPKYFSSVTSSFCHEVWSHSRKLLLSREILISFFFGFKIQQRFSWTVKRTRVLNHSKLSHSLKVKGEMSERKKKKFYLSRGWSKNSIRHDLHKSCANCRTWVERETRVSNSRK